MRQCATEKAVYETVSDFKSARRPQEISDAGNEEYLLRKTTGCEWSHPGREAMRSIAGSVIMAGPFE